jgi:hypothetical protein
MLETNTLEQLGGSLVLHKNMAETAQHLPPQATVPAEKRLAGPEQRRHQQGWHTPGLEFEEVVGPEIVLHEQGRIGLQDGQEAAGIGQGVGGQVANEVGVGVVFADFVAGGGEKTEHQLPIGELLPEGLDDGPPLLELAQGGHVHPQAALPRAFGRERGRCPPPLHPQLRLGVAEGRGEPNQCRVQADANAIDAAHQRERF